MSDTLVVSDGTLAMWHGRAEYAQMLCGCRNRDKARQLSELESIFDELAWRRKVRPVDGVADGIDNCRRMYQDARFLANREDGERRMRGAVDEARNIAEGFVRGDTARRV